MGVVALVFLAIEAGVLMPVSLLILKRRLVGVLNLRIHKMAVLLAVPRQIAFELWRLAVVVEGPEGQEEDTGVDALVAPAGGPEAQQVPVEGDGTAVKRRKASSVASVRALLQHKLDYDRIIGDLQRWIDTGLGFGVMHSCGGAGSEL